MAGADVLGIDLGGTRTKYGVVTAEGQIRGEGVAPTPDGGREALLTHLRSVAEQLRETARALGLEPVALGVATAGWVDTGDGIVVYATESLPGWTGTPIAGELAAATGLPVAVENDGNALAVAESTYGAARGVRDFVCLTLGTGVGGGCFTGGRLHHGAHFFANAVGHIPVVMDGLPCTCGLRGCLEMYANAAALVRYAGAAFGDAEQVIAAAHEGNEEARSAIGVYARHLAFGVAGVVQLLDPEVVILAGGIAQNNPLLVDSLRLELAGRVTTLERRRLRVEVSSLGYFAGVIGAAAVARERIQQNQPGR